MTGMDRLAARMSEVLGPALTLPETSESYRLTHVRTWSWPCPRCLAGDDMDVLLRPCQRGLSFTDGACECGQELCSVQLNLVFPYRPFTLDSTGRVYCHACYASEDLLIQAVQRLSL